MKIDPRTLLPLIAIVLAACSGAADSILGVPADGEPHAVVAHVGQEIDITLGNVGPGTYENPAISSGAVTFLAVDVVPPFTPAGPTQRFRFKAAATGVAVLNFRRTINGSLIRTVEDTIQVR